MRRFLLRALLALVVVGLMGAIVLYVLASRPPASYQPAQLTQKEKETSARQFVGHISEFNNKSQLNEAFEWQITQEQLNQYLASADEIAANRVGGRRGEVSQALESAGLSDPAVAVDDGILTLLVRSSQYDKVVSADLGLTFTPDRRLQIRLLQTRVGLLPVPEGFLREQLRMLKDRLRRDQEAQAATGSATAPAGSPEEIGRLIAAVLAAIDEEPITPELVGGLNHKKVRIEDIRLDDGKIVIKAQPIDRKTAQ